MKILVCGGRNYRDYKRMFEYLDALNPPATQVIHGDARGADTGADVWARVRGIPVTPVPADWNKHGRRAGPLRNEAMAKMKPDVVIAFPGGTGTANMIDLARNYDIPVLKVEA